MPEIFVPMSLEDAISWEILMVLVAIAAWIIMIIFIGMIVAIIGSLILVPLAIYWIVKQEYLRGIGLLFGWLICLGISHPVYVAGQAYIRTQNFEKQIVQKTDLPFCENTGRSDAPNRMKFIFKTNDGKMILSDSSESASAGKGQILTKDGERQWIENSVESQIQGRIHSQYSGPIDREFLGCRLAQDLSSLVIYVRSHWKKYSQDERVNAAYFYQKCLAKSLGYDNWVPAGKIIKARVFDPAGRLVAIIQTKKEDSNSYVIGLHDQKENTFWWEWQRKVRLDFFRNY